jgi:hypothetical protein
MSSAIVQGDSSQKPMIYPSLQDQCSEAKALNDIGVAPIWVLTNDGVEKVDFDFTGVSGKGLSHKDGLGVFINYTVHNDHNNCVSLNRSSFDCRSEGNKTVSFGSLVRICEIPKEGFPMRSIENAALVATASYIKTIRDYSLVTDKVPSKKVKILLFPEFQHNLNMNDKGQRVIYDLNNARWTTRSDGKEFFYHIELLPNSLQGKSAEFWLQMGVISHEIGHHIFYNRVSRLVLARSSFAVQDDEEEISYFQNSPTRTFGIETVVSAINEGYADLVSHFTFSSSTNPYYGFLLDSTEQARRVASNRSAEEKEDLIEKALTEPVIRHFVSYVRTFRPNNYTPDHQDDHAIGAIIANALDGLFGKKFNETRERPRTEDKYKLLNTWVDNIQALYLANEDRYKTIPNGAYSTEKGSAVSYDSGPALFLKDALWEAVKLAFIDEKSILNAEQCDIVVHKFPVYDMSWNKQYKCQ